MKRLIYLIIIALMFLIVATPAIAQEPVSLESLYIRLWPEYDDPNLLVIIDGQVSDTGTQLVIPIPSEADIHAVASAAPEGMLVDNDWQSQQNEDGTTSLLMTPANAIFRIEYYLPLQVNGDERAANYTLPAGYFQIADASIELLLPPGSRQIIAEPETDSSDTNSTGATQMFRSIGVLAAGDAIIQDIRYDNPAGALAVADDLGGQAVVAETDPPQTAEQSSQTRDLLLLGLGILAAALIAVGVYGYWRTRDSGASADVQPATSGTAKTNVGGGRKSVGSKDKYCRTCGLEYGSGDRFCRKCGAQRL